MIRSIINKLSSLRHPTLHVTYNNIHSLSRRARISIYARSIVQLMVYLARETIMRKGLYSIMLYM